MIIALQTLIFFRQSLLAVLDGLLRPYYKRFFTFSRQSVDDDEESEDQVFSEFDEEKGVVFYPPMYAQRYAAVTDCLMDQRWCGKLEKVVDLGYHDVSFIKYLKEIPGVKRILGVDLDSIPLRCSSDLVIEYTPMRENPLQVTLFQGNASDPDYRLIGCDAVVAIEMIEHMLPHDLDRLIHTVFGFVKPWIAVFTTPNGDFNPLFKALEKNGLRRLDHFFEWSREQFHDWCSNIVLRYPDYTVVCKGIGPGPPGTLHHGCCSQLALFIAKDYSKQQDLDLNSLALVANTKDRNNLSEFIESVESCSDGNEQQLLCLPSNNVDSIPDFISANSVSTLMATAMTIVEPLECVDKTCQCNLDTEVGKSFLMFEDDGSWHNVMVPRKKIVNRVYDIEDVASRLNCSTFQVKKFSKTTQNLMAKNKIDSLVHTREVVDEIRHLTKMLNFNKSSNSQKEDGLWRNFNWGYNAPYWNQYYKIVREYSYPFETKSEESRIVDLISEEINRLIDSQYDEEFVVDMNKMEIPMSYLMKVVQHITDDTERVKDLLEWNGYEIVDDVLIYTRFVVENISVTTHDECWQDDTLSDFETTDVHSTSLSDGSTLAPDFTGRYLQRALDHKVRKLRSMLTADDDIATELDRTVCRLMKLALRTSRIQQQPPPTRWMQCKLFDLLSLTEKAIDRRRKRFIENFPLSLPDSENQVHSVDESLATKIEKDDTVDILVNKYKFLVQSYENKETPQKTKNYSNFGGFDFDDNLSDTSNEFIKEYEFVNDVESPHPAVCIEATPISKVYEHEYTEDEEKSKLQRIQAWINEDLEEVSYPDHDVRLVSSGDTDQSATNIRYKIKKMSRKRKATVSAHIDKQDFKIRKKSTTETAIEKYLKMKPPEKQKTSKSKLFKKSTGKKSSYCLLVKANLYKTSSNSLKSKKMKDYLNSIKPIPGAFNELCHPDLKVKEKIKENMEYLINIDRVTDCDVIEKNVDVAASKESLLVSIVMDGMEETIALRRTVGTDAEDDPTEIEQETVMGSLLNVMRNDSFCNKPELATENVHSQTIFLNDINEPSTSKGVRHVSMDVQCGPDVTTPAFSTLSTTTSFTKIPKIFNNGIKIGDSELELPAKHSDCATCTGDICQCKTISPRTKSVGIIIKDSETDTNIKRNNTECFTMTNYDGNGNKVVKQTELIKPISSEMKIEDSSSDCFGSVASHNSGLISETGLKSSTSREGLGPKYACMKYVRPKLALGGMHVHSYKDKQESEDVMFQGEWQRCRPKALTKKRVVFNTGSAKKLSDLTKKLRVNSKEKLQKTKSANKEVKLEKKSANKEVKLEKIHLKPVQARTHKCDENKIKNPVPNNALKFKYNRSIPKVSNKIPVSSLTVNKPKTVFVSKKPAILLSNTTKKEPDNILKGKMIPSDAVILKRNLLKPVTKNILNKSIDSAKTASNITNEKHSKAGVTSLVRCKTEFIKKELLKFGDSPRDHISYVVLRNESENKGNKNSVSPKTNTRKNDSSHKRNHSPQSQNSSTCSSLNSIATVRVVSNRPKPTNRKISSSSNQDNIDSDTVTPVRNKKFTKKNKNVKKADANDLDNKENVPESSNSIKKDDGKVKSPYISTHKSVYRAQVATENLPLQNTSNSLSRYKTSTPIKANLKLASTSSLGKESKSQNLSCTDEVVSSQNTSTSQKSTTLLSTSNSKLPLEGDSSQTTAADSLDKNMTTCIKEMIEERLNFISNSFDDLSSIDSKTVILSRENLNYYSLDESSTPDSFRTVINNEDLDATLALQTDIEDAINRTFDSITDSTSVVDGAGALNETNIFKLQTTAESRPELLFAENDMDNLQCSFSKVNSVRDIFERRDQLMAQSDGGNLASQAFSGFSINAVAGDRPDPISLIDSETGSLAMEMGRQATSEEVFVSGRSSGSYESCLYDDAMIPYWLFHINSQFDDEDEEEPEVLPAPVELVDPVFDMNGNVVAAGAGAGDGRGMHSDQSQDSSGRGTTSTTSSDPSSGAQSEAILIDPSAFTGQFELPAIPVTTEVPESVLHQAGENIGEAAALERNGRRNPVVRLLATSDMDADVSSLDTDVQDSS